MNRREFHRASMESRRVGRESCCESISPGEARCGCPLEIAPLKLEIAPGKVIQTVAYNGQVPGPLIRWPEGKPIAIDVLKSAPTSRRSSTGTDYGFRPTRMAPWRRVRR